MTLLIIGLLLWTVVHLFRRAAPAARAGLTRTLGEGPDRGVIALLLLASVVLMVLGYQQADYIAVWTPPYWAVHLTNLLMLIALFLFGMGKSTGRVRALLRHPMLLAAVVWAAAHLLVNGDLASLILFGGIGAWALIEIVVINAQDGPWQRPAPGTVAGDVRWVIISLVAFGAVAAFHFYIGGVYPFPG
ncbi:MAG: NnrU family protein [Pseudomonadota bacterium]